MDREDFSLPPSPLTWEEDLQSKEESKEATDHHPMHMEPQMKHQGSPNLQTKFSGFIFLFSFVFCEKICTHSIKEQYYQ